MQNTVHSWLKVTRLFHSANIALELFRICSKGISPFFIISTTVADQRLLLGLNNTLANMREICFCSAATFDERIKLGRGHWCGSHVGSCFKILLCPDNGWFPPSSWHVEKQKSAILLIWVHNCLLQLAHVSYHQWNSNLTGQPVCDPPTFKFLPNKYYPGYLKTACFGMIVHILVKTWPTLEVSCKCNCKVTPSSRKVTLSSDDRELMSVKVICANHTRISSLNCRRRKMSHAAQESLYSELSFWSYINISSSCSHVVLLPEMILYFLWIDVSRHGLFLHNCNTLTSPYLYVWLACKPSSPGVSQATGFSS